MGYSEDDTLFDVLFANKEAKSFNPNDAIAKGFDNTDVKGDERKIQGSDGKEFTGYGFFVQKYLWEEYRKFGLVHGHDLADFDTYHKVRGLRWPVVNGKVTKWRLTTKFDYYAKKAAPTSGLAFYGDFNNMLTNEDLIAPKDETDHSIKTQANILFRPFMKAPLRPTKESPLLFAT
ncbi:hypothetical protein SIK57_19400, partial [Clostridioides difficile]